MGPVRHLILGTAGHIDHGKTSLVEALTGVNCDRLEIERARGMTIELGFAPLRLGEVHFGIVDVPGHERFVRTMVAGATGVDAALLVVAADDGVMPQTREHVEILRLLGVEQVVVAITKADIADARRVREVEAAVRALCPEARAVVAVSVRTGEGLEALRSALAALGRSIVGRDAEAPFRLPVDRVFTVPGRGVVVTGSVMSGQVRVGETVAVWPVAAVPGRRPGEELKARVREIQTHQQRVDVVCAGQRAALNLVGVERAWLERGAELAAGGLLTPTRYLDVEMECLASAPRAIRAHSRVRLALGTREVIAVVVPVLRGERATEVVQPGERAWVQLRPREPVVAEWGQRFIVRDESGMRTIGGGRVLRAVSRRSATREQDDVAGLAALAERAPRDRVSEVLRFWGFAWPGELAVACQAGVRLAEVKRLAEELVGEGVLRVVGGSPVRVHAACVAQLARRVRKHVRRMQEARPEEPGVRAEALRQWLSRRVSPAPVAGVLEMLEACGALRRRGEYFVDPEAVPRLTGRDAETLGRLVSLLEDGGFMPPTVEELARAVERSERDVRRLLETARADGEVVQIDGALFITRRRYEALVETVRRVAGEEDGATVSAVRRALGSTRKYVVPMMEHLDRAGVTLRRGDRRWVIEK